MTRRVVCIGAAVLIGVGAAGAQVPAPASSVQTTRINYVNADLGDVIRSLAAVLGLHVVLTDIPIRQITLLTPQPLPPPPVGALLLAILQRQGHVLVRTGPGPP